MPAVLALAGAILAVASAALTSHFLGRDGPRVETGPAVSLLKPLHGASDGLAESLKTFGDQDYPGVIEIVFGVEDASDLSMKVADAMPPRPDLRVFRVIDPQIHGANRKVSNLINIESFATRDTLVMSDADIRVGPDYLRTVVAALGEPGVGAVSCLYVGQGIAGVWSQLSAMALSYGFLPNAVLGMRLGLAHPCFGSTIALTRDTLTRIGGFEAFVGTLADDYEIGRAVRRLGLTVAIPPMVVTHVCDESSARQLMAHEIRWARTVRLIDAAGHAGSLVTHAFPLALIAGALSGFRPLALGLIFTTLVVRIAAKFAIDDATGARAGPWWLLPVRDVLSFGVFLASFAGRAVTWQGRRFRVTRDGVLTQL